MYSARNHINGENFKLQLCTCAHALGTCTKFPFEILIRSTIYNTQILRKYFGELKKREWNTPLVLVVPHQLGQTPACVLAGPAIDLLMSPKFGWPPQAWYLLGAGCPGAISSTTLGKTQGSFHGRKHEWMVRIIKKMVSIEFVTCKS